MRIAWIFCAALLSLSIVTAQTRVTGVVNGGSFQPLVAPGSFATASVTGLSVTAITASTPNLPFALGGVSATVNGQPAPLYYVSATQINFQVPRNTAPGAANLVVRFNNTNSAPFQFQVAAAAPGILAYGSNLAVAQFPDGVLITPSNPISSGRTAVIYLTGVGPVDNPAADAVPTPFPPLATATSQARVTVGGATASLQFLGLTPGFVGLAQANIVVPDLPPGDYPVVLTVGGNASSSNGPLLSVTRGPLITLLSGSLTIDPDGTDSYTFQGEFRGLSLDGVPSIAFQIGQFAANIPLNRFTRQPGSNVLTYADETGLNPYWISSLSIDPDAGIFTARANGIALSGLPNPFPLRFGASESTGCAMARMQRTGSTTYELFQEATRETPCLIEAAPIDPVRAGARRSVTFQARIQAAAGLDPRSIRLYRVNENAQPIGDPLCTLAAQAGGLYSCTVTVDESQAAIVPLLVQATAGARTLLSIGFPLNIVRAGNASDEAQLTSIENAMTEAERYFTEFGESPHARTLAIAALRKLFPGRPPLTASPAGLSLDGLSIDARTDSGVLITLLRNRIDESAGDGSALPAAESRPAPRRLDAFLAPLGVASPRGADPQSIRCGDFQRDVVKNSKVLLWSTDDLFFDDPDIERFIQDLVHSKCPKFDIKVIKSSEALPASLDRFSEYGTIFISSHGSRGYGAGALVTASTDRQLAIKDPDHYALILEDYHAIGPGGGKVRRKGEFVAMVRGNPLLRQLDKSVIFGAFCFSDLLAGSFLGSGSSYHGYPDIVITARVGFDAIRLFKGLVNDYKSTGEIQSFSIHKGNGNLSYTGNPKLTAPRFGGTGPYPATPGGSLTLEAKLEGTEQCDGKMQLHWKNLGLSGTLRPARQGSGVNDYTVADLEANYSASSSGSGTSDEIRVDFQPNGEPGSSGGEVAARACATVAPPRQEVAIGLTGVFHYSNEGPHNLTFYNPVRKVTTDSPFETSDSSLGGTASAKVEQTGRNTWKMTQQFASPTRTDIFTDTLNRVDLALTNFPGPLQIRIHVEANITGTCKGLDATFAGTGAPIRRFHESGNGCQASWDFQGPSYSGPTTSLFSVVTGGLGSRGSTYGAAGGTVTTTIELLDSPDPFLP